MGNHQRTVPELIRTIKALQAKAAQAADKADQFYISLGLTLAELKKRKPEGTSWPAFVKKHFGYSQQRADELIRISDGKTTVATVRKNKRVSVRRSRAKSTLRSVGNGHALTKSDACDEVDYPKQAGATAEEQAIFNVRYCAVQAIDYCQRAVEIAKPVETVTKKMIETVREAADAWTTLAKNLERRLEGDDDAKESKAA